jgi:hypothetical protein
MTTPRKRATFIDTYTLQRLDLAVRPIVLAFDEYPYLVGSANAKADYRDVDLRLILPNKKFDALFKTEKREDGQRLWALLCYSTTAWLRFETGLPIDFQIQRQTEANKKYGNQFRNPLGGRGLNFAAYGDATNLWPRDRKTRAAYLRRRAEKT